MSSTSSLDLRTLNDTRAPQSVRAQINEAKNIVNDAFYAKEAVREKEIVLRRTYYGLLATNGPIIEYLDAEIEVLQKKMEDSHESAAAANKRTKRASSTWHLQNAEMYEAELSKCKLERRLLTEAIDEAKLRYDAVEDEYDLALGAFNAASMLYQKTLQAAGKQKRPRDRSKQPTRQR